MRLRVLMTTVALVVGGLLPMAGARAVSLDVTCAGTETAGYQPGLLLTARTTAVTVNGILAPCTSSDPDITSGTYLQHFDATLSCATLLGGLSATRVFTWSNGDTSTFSYNRAVNNALGQVTVTFTGTIVSGRFAGDTAVEQVVLVSPNPLQCLAEPGLTALGPGVAVLTIDKV
jgi:hypothetical protein